MYMHVEQRRGRHFVLEGGNTTNLFSLGPHNHGGRGGLVSLAGTGWASSMVMSPICYQIRYVVGRRMKATFSRVSCHG